MLNLFMSVLLEESCVELCLEFYKSPFEKGGFVLFHMLEGMTGGTPDRSLLCSHSQEAARDEYCAQLTVLFYSARASETVLPTLQCFPTSTNPL